MSDAPPSFDFSQFVPGFDFLKNLTSASTKAGGAVPGMPGMSSWVAPTLSVEEVEKRIQELKTVQYWLEQNGHALKATIQALEVQKMTLSTLRGMNVRMEDLANAFTRSAAPRAASPEPASPAPEPEALPAGEDPAGAGVVDPMQWWSALTQQFQQIATTALQEASNLKMPAMAQPMADAMNQVGQAMSGAVKAVTVAGAAAKAPPSARKPSARKKPAAKKAGTASRRRAAGGRPE